jgi:hypothetical protein
MSIFWEGQPPEEGEQPLTRPHAVGDFVLVKYGAKGSQVARVYQVTQKGTYLVRKWRASGRKWTAGIYVQAHQVIRRITRTEAEKIVGAANLWDLA